MQQDYHPLHTSQFKVLSDHCHHFPCISFHPFLPSFCKGMRNSSSRWSETFQETCIFFFLLTLQFPCSHSTLQLNSHHLSQWNLFHSPSFRLQYFWLRIQPFISKIHSFSFSNRSNHFSQNSDHLQLGTGIIRNGENRRVYGDSRGLFSNQRENCNSIIISPDFQLGLGCSWSSIQHRIVKVYHQKRTGFSAIALEGTLIAYLYAILLILDTISSCLFFKYCKPGCQMDEDGCSPYQILTEDRDHHTVLLIKTLEQLS